MTKILCFKTIMGWVSIKEKDNKIISILFDKTKNKGKSSKLFKCKNTLMNYFSKKSIKTNLNIFLQGSKLQIKIWKELKKIPYGKTKSYGDIAKKVQTSPRYVGKVCGQNKHLIFIPCHRVIRKDGNLGGFSGRGGISTKKKLLKLENS